MLSSKEYEEFLDQCVYRIESGNECREVLMDCWERAWEEALNVTLGAEEDSDDC